MPGAGSEDGLAKAYYLMLEKNTPFQESQWNAQTGSYPDTDFYFAGTLGNAVLLKFGSYDESITGVPRAQLQDHTVRSIAYAAAHNRFANPSGDWGANTFWDSTFESYFAAAAHLMWDDLDAQTRTDVDTIVRGEADRMTDPSLDVGTTHWPTGGYQGDTKLEEFGTMTMPLAAALAYDPDDPHAPKWREWLDRWMANMNGLPVADQVNPTLIDGVPISGWTTAHNIYDSFIVENHGPWSPIYQQAAGAYPGRDTTQFLIAGAPVPQIMRSVPNEAAMWDTMGQLGTDAGVPEDFMVADRHHLYGRNVFPIAYESMVMGDPFAARAEQLLADHLGPYVDYPPAGRLTKFSGEPKYEPEARAELGMAFLLHYWRDRLAGDVQPASAADYFKHFSSARNYGLNVGLVAQQSPQSLAAAVTKSGYVKFAFLPQHDDWLFNVAGSSPSLIPSTAAVDDHSARVYRQTRDGFEGTATVVRRGGGYAGFTSLPGGEVVYATTGTASNEGVLNLYNLDMPGVAGLDGDRTYTAADGSATLRADDVGTRTFNSRWLNIDGRAGFVVRHSDNPISVSATSATLSAGPAAGASGMVVQGFPAQSPTTTAHEANVAQPSGGPTSLRAALTGNYLSLFNLGGTAIDDAALTVPQDASSITLFQGEQETTSTGTTYRATLDPATAQVQPPRFQLSPGAGHESVPANLDITVVDSHHVTVTNRGDDPVAGLTLVSTATGESQQFAVPPGKTAKVTFERGPLTPVTDLARAQLTYPVAPLPPGMSDPAGAVDGDSATSWIPGAADRRLVVNLGARHPLTGASLEWTHGAVPAYTVEASDDGVHWTPVANTNGAGTPEQRFTFNTAANYVSVQVPHWSAGDAGLAELSVQGSQEVLPTNGDGGVDELRFAPTQARYLRMLGVQPATGYGYSVYEFEARGPGDDTNLAAHQPTTASSFDDGDIPAGGPFTPELATDGNPATRWAVSKADRARTDSWLAVDLGTERTVDDVRILWESAYGSAYRIQASADGQTWRDLAAVP